MPGRDMAIFTLCPYVIRSKVQNVPHTPFVPDNLASFVDFLIRKTGTVLYSLSFKLSSLFYNTYYHKILGFNKKFVYKTKQWRKFSAFP